MDADAEGAPAGLCVVRGEWFGEGDGTFAVGHGGHKGRGGEDAFMEAAEDAVGDGRGKAEIVGVDDEAAANGRGLWHWSSSRPRRRALPGMNVRNHHYVSPMALAVASGRVCEIER